MVDIRTRKKISACTLRLVHGQNTTNCRIVSGMKPYKKTNCEYVPDNADIYCYAISTVYDIW